MACFFFFSCITRKVENSVGKYDGMSNYSLRKNIVDSLTIVWNDLLRQENINSKITNLKIINEKDLVTKKEYFALFGKTNNDSAKVACSVEVRDGKVYFPKSKMFLAVICFGSRNCTPAMYNNKWICDDGTKSQSQSCSLNCKKKSVATIIEN